MSIENNGQINITDAEKRIVKLLAEGKSGKRIAKETRINYNTFAFNLSILKGKCGVKNTPSLIAHFLRNKYID